MIEIEKVVTEEEGSRPVMVNFQNGKIQPGREQSLKSESYQHGDKHIVGISNYNQMLYAGKITDENDLYKNFVLRRDKETKELSLIQVDQSFVLPILEQKTDILNISLENTVTELNRNFGSKKTKRHTEQQQRLKMNIDAVKEQLEQTVSGIKIDEVDQSLLATQDSYLPKINREAATVDQVYNIDDLVPLEVLNFLKEEADEVLNNLDNIKETYSFGFITERLSQLTSLFTPNEATYKKLTLTLYIYYLMKFMVTPMKQIGKKFVLCECQEVNNHILDNYSDNSGNIRTRPLYLKDKIICSILVLAALSADYEVELQLLSENLKVGIKKLLDISRVLAFTPTKSKSIVLKLPLPSPLALSAKKKRR